MSGSGHGVQVVEVLEDHSFRLDEAALAAVLTQEGIKDLPVAVVSLAGAARGGKSFLLNFLLRYLSAPESARRDGSWLGGAQEPLTGFSWRGGSERNTTGIHLWSAPLFVIRPDGTKVAVLLMDTQGTFDNKSTVRDCSTIFALSTLMSSVQIYNLPGGLGIQEDDLQHLELFAQYGALAGQGQNEHKAFQVLEFLIRDWGYDDEFAFGDVGGQQYLDERVMKVSSDMPTELRALREHLRESFETLACFLMPHPGLIVRKKAFEGKVADIDPDFTACLRTLISSIFSPEKLIIKTIQGQPIKCGQLTTYFKTYMAIFNSKGIPTPKTILEASTEASLLLAMEVATSVYNSHMEAVCGPQSPAVAAAELQAVHQRERGAARASFQAARTLASPQQAQNYLDKLTEDLDKRLPYFVSINMSKTQRAIDEADQTYEDKISAVKGNRPLCLHEADVAGVHSEAVSAALAVFDAKRRRTTNDVERDHLTEDLEDKLISLNETNTQNNRIAVMSIVNSYWEKMQRKTRDMVSVSLLDSMHRAELKDALDEFARQRTRPNSHPYDSFKTSLINDIDQRYEILSSSNAKKRDAFNRAEEARLRAELLRRQREREEWERELQRRREQLRRERLEQERRERESGCTLL